MGSLDAFRDRLLELSKLSHATLSVIQSKDENWTSCCALMSPDGIKFDDPLVLAAALNAMVCKWVLNHHSFVQSLITFIEF